MCELAARTELPHGPCLIPNGLALKFHKFRVSSLEPILGWAENLPAHFNNVKAQVQPRGNPFDSFVLTFKIFRFFANYFPKAIFRHG